MFILFSSKISSKEDMCQAMVYVYHAVHGNASIVKLLNVDNVPCRTVYNVGD